jgi:hypothetical protein
MEEDKLGIVLFVRVIATALGGWIIFLGVPTYLWKILVAKKK